MDATDENMPDRTGENLLRVPHPCCESQWCCLYTRPRHEKKVARACERLDVGVYLPLRRVTRRYSSGKKVYWLPLFPGYVFCRPTPGKRVELSGNERVLTVIDVPDQERFVDELRQIYRALKVSAELDTVPYLAAGREVEIVRGPFKGIKGVIEQTKGRFRLMLIATMMNRSVPLEVDIGDVEPLE